jgi:predicted RNase H-like HicB family nuclease
LGSFDDDPEGCSITDLLTMNTLSDDRYYKETDALVICLGQSLSDVYLYNSGSGAFEIHSMKSGGKALGSFGSFEKLFVRVIGDRMASIRDEEAKRIKQYIAFIRTDGGSSVVVFPDFPGCVSEGKDFEDTVSTAREDLFDHAEGMRKAGKKIPKPRSLEQIKASWKDWPLWKDSDYITVPLELISNDTKSHIMINSSPLRLDRATRNRDGHRDGEPSIFKNGGCKEHIYISISDYCAIRLLAFMKKNPSRSSWSGCSIT